jgi:hypothetical protein
MTWMGCFHAWNDFGESRTRKESSREDGMSTTKLTMIQCEEWHLETWNNWPRPYTLESASGTSLLARWPAIA